MDFSQTKLSKMEWESIEIPVSDQEKQILRLIQDGYGDLSIKHNDNMSLLSFMKIEPSPEIEMYLYDKYFAAILQTMLQKCTKKAEGKATESKAGAKASGLFAEFRPKMPNVSKFKPPKKIDLMRLQNTDANLSSGTFDKTRIFEFIQLDFCEKILCPAKQVAEGSDKTHTPVFYLYTLLHMKKSAILHVNPYVGQFVDQLMDFMQSHHSEHWVRDAFRRSYTLIEKNPYLLKFDNKTLYDHQKHIFQLFRRGDPMGEAAEPPPKMVLYTAPTGTGKTMTPLGLSEEYRVIYICAARHIGLALARSAISMEKRVAFAFGCETAADIRLHYYSAVEYTKNHKTGGIFRVDNSNGSKVEIMICDVHSYRTAMHYMLAFHQQEDVILYWDEPTISLDVASHELHTVIRQNWQENKVANIVLACATLPEDHEIITCLDDYRDRFDGGVIHRVCSSDCKKSISLLTSDGYAMLPHLLFSSYEQLQQSVVHCETHSSLLRYLDLREIVRLVTHLESVPGALPEAYHVQQYFERVGDITMNSIKKYYMCILKEVAADLYPSIHEYLKTTRRPMFGGGPGAPTLTKHQSVDSGLGRGVKDVAEFSRTVSSGPGVGGPPSVPHRGVQLTTSDAHTLTDGPTIYLVEDVTRMGIFYAQNSHIPIQILDGIMQRIEQNGQIQKRMEVLMKSLDDMLGKEADKERKMNNDVLKPEAKRLMTSIESLRGNIQLLSIGAKYTPNTRPHQQQWVGTAVDFVENAFVPSVDDASILKIMELDVDARMKLLLLMGIGVFDSMTVQSKDPGTSAYVEVMKRLASQQQLFLIIASSDYIYGTNYQLCHGFLGKDLRNMTQQKIIQAMGRIGRNHVQQEYTVRFRDESLITQLFLPATSNLEAENMCRLLVA